MYGEQSIMPVVRTMALMYDWRQVCVCVSVSSRCVQRDVPLVSVPLHN